MASMATIDQCPVAQTPTHWIGTPPPTPLPRAYKTARLQYCVDYETVARLPIQKKYALHLGGPTREAGGNVGVCLLDTD